MEARLYRIILRQRVVFTPGVDATSPATIKPLETEGASVERDITDYALNYKISRKREALSAESTVEFLNTTGMLTPENFNSALNRSADGSTYTPLLADGNEVQIYRIASAADLAWANRADKTKWVPRFRGKVRQSTSGVAEGRDSLKVTIGDALSDLGKCTVNGTFSPIMRSGSFVPANTFTTMTRLGEGITRFLNITSASSVMVDGELNDKNFASIPDSAPGPISARLLSRLIYWDQADFYRLHNQSIAPPYFKGSTFPNEAKSDATVQLLLTANNATAVWLLNSPVWLVTAGTVTKDATDIFEDPEGSLALSGLTGATVMCECDRVPFGVKSCFKVNYKAATAVNFTFKVSAVLFNRATQTYGVPVVLSTTTLSGPTIFNAIASLGGQCVNDPGTTALEWKNVVVEDLPAIPYTYMSNVDAESVWLFRTEISSAGVLSIDCPRWEFNSVERSVNNTAVIRDNNVLSHPRLERWRTEDGITFTDPYPSHRSLSGVNVRVILRDLSVPYAAGTREGFGPTHLENRLQSPTAVYERELVAGSEYEILFDKRSIQMSNQVSPHSEVFVAHTQYDLPASSHMECSAMIKHLLVTGGGIPANKIFLEPTGIILAKISMGAATSSNVLDAIQNIRQQLPQNYLLMADGDANIIGKFIQQSGSPRIYNPITQVHVSRTGTGFTNDKEYWYGISALMPDGKETLVSNLLSTVEYQNYFDAAHKSLVQENVCPAQLIRPVPNMKALVIRRAEAYKSAGDAVIQATPAPQYSIAFDKGFFATKSDNTTVALVGAANFQLYTTSHLTGV